MGSMGAKLHGLAQLPFYIDVRQCGGGGGTEHLMEPEVLRDRLAA